MTPITIGATVLGVAGLGAWLRYAVTPVCAAYRIGRAVGRYGR